MKVFVLAPREDWICDRLVSEWYENFPNSTTNYVNEADVIWLLAGWCWNHLPFQVLKNKKIVVTEHHIVPEKFNQEKYKNFMMRDQFVDCYHVPNGKTKHFLQQLTNKRIDVISYWYNDKLWYPVDSKNAKESLQLQSGKYYIGSFQRDTEGSDLKTPKLEKGPDLFCDYLIRNRRQIEELGKMHVLLGGWRRQYVEKRLKSENIEYSLYEKANIDVVRNLYAACSLYIVSSRFEGGPQAIIEASAMKIPVISTDVGIASNILSKNCIVNIEKDYYNPNSEDVEFAFNKVKNIAIKEHGKKFIKLFEEIM
jgi:glycosyltransferase involved in cell wall biosynthesis